LYGSCPPNEVILVLPSPLPNGFVSGDVITITLFFIRKTAYLLRHNGSAAIAGGSENALRYVAYLF
jgi:hypothetical protein